jgi:hypothetical protein
MVGRVPSESEAGGGQFASTVREQAPPTPTLALLASTLPTASRGEG